MELKLNSNIIKNYKSRVILLFLFVHFFNVDAQNLPEFKSAIKLNDFVNSSADELRPVFNSDYKSTIINIIDNDVVFTYKEFQAIELGENQFISNLSHILAYYANMVIGMDHETFEKKGGEIYLQKALDLGNSVADDLLDKGAKAILDAL